MIGFTGIMRGAEVWSSNTQHWHLFGPVYEDEIFPDGEDITTSRIEKVESFEGGFIVSTRTGSKYCVPSDTITRSTKEQLTKIMEEGATTV